MRREAALDRARAAEAEHLIRQAEQHANARVAEVERLANVRVAEAERVASHIRWEHEGTEPQP